MSPVWVDIGVGMIVGMSLWAISSAGALRGGSDASQRIGAVGDSLKMVRVDAISHPAEVIDS